MPTPVVLNELSCSAWPDCRFAGADLIRVLAQALATLGRLPRRTFLLSQEPIGGLDFGPYTFASFLSDAFCRDAMRVILAFANRSPLSDFGDLDVDGGECFVGDASAKGLHFSYLLNAPLLSFSTNENWSESSVTADFIELDDNAAVSSTQIVVPNVSRPEHVEVHRQVIVQFREHDPADGDELWSQRLEWFPSLDFLDRVEGDLSCLSAGSLELEQVVLKLFELEYAIGEWNPDKGLPRWRTKVTPESEQRMRLCRFSGSDGKEHTYEWHARFTPGPGRIHFRLMQGSRRIEIAYVGRKLGV